MVSHWPAAGSFFDVFRLTGSQGQLVRVRFCCWYLRGQKSGWSWTIPCSWTPFFFLEGPPANELVSLLVPAAFRPAR